MIRIQIIEGIHPRECHIAFDLIITSDWLWHILLRILWLGSLEPPHQLNIAVINFSLYFTVLCWIKRLFEKNLSAPDPRCHIKHSVDQHWVMLIYILLPFSIMLKVPYLSCLALGRESRKEYFLGADVLTFDFILRRLCRCFLCASCFHLRSRIRLDATRFHILSRY